MEIPKTKVVNLRRKVKQLTGRDSIFVSLGDKLREINPMLRGWSNYYRHCSSVSAGMWVCVCSTGSIRNAPKRGCVKLWGSKQPNSRRPTRRLWREGRSSNICSAGPRLPASFGIDGNA
ncbi:hypothetical protein PYH37_006088 (plasmid) [Sinorhizobium numidicum]|uniref:Group II intron maturase-specific domain-containing protein n=1 Tax=Sinorhizobium numidicum TaxID=680248 RepID=A0ABY8D6N8_9HYPH|nr:group II intron maturase-specific domain-containing protein [Sinorhizobium numidicum]WEX79680.1 hypothetical protein PYH37_006088 [Sinorhizobium numidicum]WEX85367.1 hypothetical protein PYH38_006299 [Sinorhizobium numidicum]